MSNVDGLVAEIREQLKLVEAGLKRADAFSENTLTGIRDSLISPLQRIQHMLDEQDIRLLKADRVKSQAAAKNEARKKVRRKVSAKRKAEAARAGLEGAGAPAGKVIAVEPDAEG